MLNQASSRAIVYLAAILAAAALQAESSQTDWSAGGGVEGPVGSWQTSFRLSSGVSWLAVPGQLTLAGTALAEPTASTVADDANIPASVAAGDLDGDGLTDVVTTDPVYDVFGQRGAIYWWQREPSGSWQQHTVSDDFYGAHFADTADVDADGDLDVIAAAYYGSDGRDGRFAWFENLDGRGLRWEEHLAGTLFWGANYVADVDGDGALEAVVSTEDIYSPTSPEVVAYELTEFAAGGELTSSILDGGVAPDWRLVRWPEPDDPAAVLLFEVRTGGDPSDLGSWLPVTAPGTDLAGIVDSSPPYFQYRITLSSTNPEVSPIVDEVAVNTVFLQSIEPGIAGQPNTVTALWPYAGDRVQFYFGRQAGSTALAGCPGVSLGIARPRRIGVGVVSGGIASVEVSLPSAAQGRTFFFQAVEQATCAVSNIVVRLFE